MRVPLNATMAIWSQLTGLLGYFRTAQMQRRTVELVDRVELQAGRIGQLVRTLSGGNQQKVVLAKWLAAEPQLTAIAILGRLSNLAPAEFRSTATLDRPEATQDAADQGRASADCRQSGSR